VYWGTSSGNYAQGRGNGVYVTGTSYLVSNLARGTTYYFAVTAYDAAGLESGFSAEATKTIP
jgi:fibronectin type 3 domain-containing protein